MVLTEKEWRLRKKKILKIKQYTAIGLAVAIFIMLLLIIFT
ncbi:hypothetical protein [Lachnoclostridium phytofermentans]|nr:hypothetical protein [Lachnoclostridium phytofermentans]